MTRPAQDAPAGAGVWLSFVFCLAYDWRLGLKAIAAVWDIADEIIVGLDGRGRTWAGDRFTPPEPGEFLDALEATLPDEASGGRGPGDELVLLDRLRLVVGDFWRAGVDRKQLQIQERLALTQLCKPGGWIFTLDADEELVNPAEVRAWCNANPPRPGAGLNCTMTSVYKVIGETALVYDRPARQFPVAQADPGVFIDGETRAQSWQLCPAHLLHWHLGRDERELTIKLRALSPCSRPPDDMVAIWRETTLENYWDGQPRGGTCYSDSDPLRAVPLAMLRATAERGAL
jgi:hypothetical protein